MLLFQDDPDETNRSEDRLYAYTWKKVIDQVVAGNPDPDRDIILRCPMTKVRATAARGQYTRLIDSS